MPRLAYGKSAYLRTNGDLPEIKLVNLLLEASPTDDEGVVLLGRAGLTTHSSPGASGSVDALFSKAGIFSGDIFSVVNAAGTRTIYRGTNSLGTLAGSGPISFATDGIDELLIAGGSTMRRYDGATLANVTFPDGASVGKVVYIGGLFVAARANSQKFYWSAVADGSSWNAVDFASAEGSPDSLLDILTVGDVMWLFGQETTEAWALSGDSALPFRKVVQRSYERGIFATGCAVELGGRLFWIGQDARPYSDGLEPIADEGLAERIRASATVSCFAFTYEGHPIFCVRLAEGTWGYDVTTGSWLEFTSYERANWRAKCALTKGFTVYLGDDELNRIWTFEGNTENSAVIEHFFTALIPIEGNPIMIDNISLYGNVGRTAVLSGAGADPVVEMRYSRNGGKSWSAWQPRSMGRTGEHRQRVQWRRLGMFDSPGAMFDFRYTDVTRPRISGLSINEPSGGRWRQ